MKTQEEKSCTVYIVESIDIYMYKKFTRTITFIHVYYVWQYSPSASTVV